MFGRETLKIEMQSFSLNDFRLYLSSKSRRSLVEFCTSFRNIIMNCINAKYSDIALSKRVNSVARHQYRVARLRK